MLLLSYFILMLNLKILHEGLSDKAGSTFFFFRTDAQADFYSTYLTSI